MDVQLHALERITGRIQEIQSRFTPAELPAPPVVKSSVAEGSFTEQLQKSLPSPGSKNSVKNAANGTPRTASGQGSAATKSATPVASGVLIPEVARWNKLATKIGKEEGVDPKLLLALVQQESGGDPNIGSSAGAQGLTQLMPGTARGLGVTNIKDPEQNMRGGARYLKRQMDRFGSLELGLAAYNAGPGAVVQYGGIPPYQETQGYVTSIKAIYRQL